MHFARVAIEGNSFLGIFARTNDRITLLPKNASEKLRRVCSEVLKTRVACVSIANSNLVGMMSAMNSNGIVLPNVAYESEVRQIGEEIQNIAVVKEKRTALGNNVLVNDYGCMVNPSIGRESAEEIGSCLGVEVVRGTIGGIKTVGGMAVATNSGILTRSSVSDDELASIESIFKVKGSVGTANMGVPFVGLCMVANSNGFVAGEMTSGFELQRIDEALGFI